MYLDTAAPRRVTTVLDRVCEIAAADPDRPAILGGGGTVTYRRLARQAGAVAEWLRAKGVGRGDTVGVARSRGPLLPALILGIHARGAVYLPIDPANPPALRDRIVGMTAPFVVVRDDDVLPADGAPPAPVPVSGDDPAYIIFTSGSTGDPKGVLLSHGGLAAYACALPARVGMTADDRCLGLAPPGFSSSVRQILLPLTVGASVVILTEDEVRTPWAFAELLDRHRVTQLDVVPSFWRAFTDTGDEGELTMALRHVRRIMFASERLEGGLVRRARRLAPDARVWNMYGCSETTGIVAMCDVTGMAGETGLLPIGTALDHVTLTTHPHLNGDELVVSGSAVALGYLGSRPEPADPTAPGERLIRTGDLVAVDDHGRYVWRGRKDQQSKVRGFRVDHAAVEAELARCPGVQRAVVVATGEDGVRVAYAERPGHVLAPRDLLRWARTTMPPHMVPAVAARIAPWPTLPNGKTDLVRLRRMTPAPAES